MEARISDQMRPWSRICGTNFFCPKNGRGYGKMLVLLNQSRTGVFVLVAPKIIPQSLVAGRIGNGCVVWQVVEPFGFVGHFAAPEKLTSPRLCKDDPKREGIEQDLKITACNASNSAIRTQEKTCSIICGNH
jgi:hypothetical protein